MQIFRLTGINPFLGANTNETLVKNKEGTVTFAHPNWADVSAEAKDLVKKMVAKDPLERATAHEALQHSWITSEHKSIFFLSTAHENMMKYHNKANEFRFNVEKIKPEFSMATCTPLFASKGTESAGQDSPLVLSRKGSKNTSPISNSPLVLSRKGSKLTSPVPSPLLTPQMLLFPPVNEFVFCFILSCISN